MDEKREPTLIFVLDFSGSMNKPVEDIDTNELEKLKISNKN